MTPEYIVHTTTVIHKEYVVKASKKSEITSGWLALVPADKEKVICNEIITHIKSINDKEVAPT
jgi:hypothetical protein